MPNTAPCRRTAGAILFLAILGVYLALPNRNYCYDSVAYAWFIKSGRALFHPHHLLHSPLGFLLVRGLRFLGIPASPMVTMQTLNSLAGALGVWLFFRTLCRLCQNLFSAVVFSLLLGFSFTYWYNSIENEVMIIPLAILMYILLRLVALTSERQTAEPFFWMKLGIAGSLAVLFYEMHIVLPIAVLFLIAGYKKRLGGVGKTAALYLTPYLPIVGGAYLAAARFTHNLSSWNQFLRWSTLYIIPRVPKAFGVHTLRLAPYGIPRAFVRATFLKNFLLNGAMTPTGWLLLSGSVVVGLLLLYSVLLTGTRLRRNLIQRTQLFLLAWVLAYGIFALWCGPQGPDFYLSALPPFWALLCLGTKDVQRSVVLVLLAGLFLVNFAGEIIPNSSLERNEAYQLVLKLRSHDLTHQDLILTPDPVIDPYYLYFFEEELRISSLADIESPGQEEKRRAFAEMAETMEGTLSAGGRVFISEDELTPNPRKLHPTRLLTVSDYRDFYRNYEERLRKVFSYQWDGKQVAMFELER